jgi:hypothetical protein
MRALPSFVRDPYAHQQNTSATDNHENPHHFYGLQ